MMHFNKIYYAAHSALSTISKSSVYFVSILVRSDITFRNLNSVYIPMFKSVTIFSQDKFSPQ